MTSANRRLLLVVMCVGYFLVLLDVTVVNVALPSVGTGLGAGVSGLQWVVDGYALPLAALLLAGGTIGDIRGHKRVVMVGMVLFGGASAACALAPSTGTLVAARVAQGTGAALLLPGTLAVISIAFPEPRRQALAIGVWAGVGSIALPAGPLLGGLLVQGLGWRWVFLINVPIVVVAGLVAARIVPDDRTRGARRIDYPGTALGALTLAAATFAVIEAGRRGLDVGVAAAAVMAAVAVAAFVAVERRIEEPMVPLSLFRAPAFSTANTVAGMMNLGSLGLLFVLTLYLQSVQGRSALSAGVAVLPLFLPLVVLAPLGGAVVSRTGPKLPAVTGLAIAALGVGLLSTWTASTPYVQLLPALLCWGAGLGLLTPSVVAAAVAAAPPERSGMTSGINNTARQAGGAVGIAVYGAIAGMPGALAHFLRGLHALALGTTTLYVVAAALAGWLFPSRPHPADQS